MTLNIEDRVFVKIKEKRLCGLHIVEIINYKQYDAILIPLHSKGRRFKTYNVGMILWARVIRINSNLVDLVELTPNALLNT